MGQRSPMHCTAQLQTGAPIWGSVFDNMMPQRRTWIIEYLNVPNSFLRRQVNGKSGSVRVSGRNVTVTSESPSVVVHEHYQVETDNAFVYRLDVSNDGGKSWKEGELEMTLRRSRWRSQTVTVFAWPMNPSKFE